jgi:hypothetical protein
MLPDDRSTSSSAASSASLLLLKGVRSLYQRSNLCLAIELHAFPARHGPIRDKDALVFWPLQLHGLGRNPIFYLVSTHQPVADCSSAAESSHPSMASGNTPTNPPTGGTGGGPTLPTVSAARIKAASNSTFSMPLGTTLEVLSGQNWSVWSGVITAILQLNEVDAILTHKTCPAGVNEDDWGSVQKKTKAYLCLYCSADVFSTVASNTDFPSFKHKFDRLKETYRGVGSTAVFNLWIELTQARLDESSPLAPQLAKLNEACVKLSNTNMGVSDIQYCLILLHALPSSYEVVASTLLASGPASNLKYSEITARILNEEGRKSGPSSE